MEVKATECRLCKYNSDYDNISFILTDDTFIKFVKELEKNQEINTKMIKEYNNKDYLFIPLKRIKSMNVVNQDYKTKEEILRFFADRDPDTPYEFDLDLKLERYSFNGKKGYTFKIKNMVGTFGAR